MKALCVVAWLWAWHVVFFAIASPPLGLIGPSPLTVACSIGLGLIALWYWVGSTRR